MNKVNSNKNKKIKTKELWQNLMKEPYYNPELDKKIKEKYYESFFKTLSKSEIDFLTNKTREIKPIPRKEIYQSLADLHKKHYSHSRRRPILFDLIDRRPDGSLRCLYTNQVLEEAKQEDWTILSQTGEEENIETKTKNKFDEEHTFPQSYQSGTKLGTGRDMHQMFAVCKSANGKRGNKAFALGELNKKKLSMGCIQNLEKLNFTSQKKTNLLLQGHFYILCRGIQVV